MGSEMCIRDRITAAAPVAVAAPAAGGGDGAAAAEEQTAFDVVLTEAGGQKIGSRSCARSPAWA